MSMSAEVSGKSPGDEELATPEPAGGSRRRLGRPRGPVRVPLTVRILAGHNERLTEEVGLQGLSPQYLVEQALSEYFTRLDRQRGDAT